MAGKRPKQQSSGSLDATNHALIRSIVSRSQEARERLSEDELGEFRKYIVANRVDDFLAEKSDTVPLTQMYLLLFNSLLLSPGLGEYRTVACDTLTVWIQRTSQCCLHSPDFSTRLVQETTAGSANDVDIIFDFICEYWTDSGAALGNALRELFMKTMSLIERLWTADERSERLGAWIDRILKYPRTMRVVYFTLEILARQLGGQIILDKDLSIIHDSLQLTYSNALANPVSKMITAILITIRKFAIESLGKEPDFEAVLAVEKKWLEIWRSEVASALRDDNLRSHIQTYLLPNIFRVSAVSCRLFINELQKQPLHTESDISVLIGCLKVAQDLALLDGEQSDTSSLSADFLRVLLHHISEDLRIGGLSLAVSSHQASKPISTAVLDILTEAFDDLILDSDPEFRNRVYGFMRQMTTRVRDSCYALTRERKKCIITANLTRAKQIEALVAANENFLNGYLNYLLELLRPGSSYQRIHMSLKLLKVLIRAGLDDRVDAKWHEKNHIDFPFNIPIFTSKLVRLLLDNLMNNYEDIRDASIELLKMAPVTALFEDGVDKKLVVDGYCEKGLCIIKGLRGREGDGGARILDFCYYLYSNIGDGASEAEFLDKFIGILESSIQEAERNLSSAVKEYPLHGFFSGLRFVFAQIDYDTEKAKGKAAYWRWLHERLIRLAYSVWNIVEKILCHDAPEGNLPEEIEEQYLAALEEQYGPATQLILSYAWRAIGESSGLLTVLLSRIPDDEYKLLGDNDVADLGSLLLNELATIRHRGAFSSVYPTFVECCARCNRSPSNKLVGLPNQWLEENIQLIQSKAQYITRRSGGLPFLVAGVLTAETDPNRPLLQRTFDRLAEIAEKPAYLSDKKIDLPQVHALNCIKSIFVEARLSAPSAFFVDRALAMAINSFASEMWSIRNCGVMLFAALQTRLFGSRKFTDSRLTVGSMSARLFFSRFKNVKDILLQHLEKHVYQLGSLEASHVETVYPVLSLLARLEGTNEYSGLDAFRPLIMNCLSSRIWKIREIAARSLLAVVSSTSWLETYRSLIDGLSKSEQNGTHGRLLAVQVLSESFACRTAQAEMPVEVYTDLAHKFEDMVKCGCSPNILAFLRVCKTVIDYPRRRPAAGAHLETPQSVLVQKVNVFLLSNFRTAENGVGDRLLQEQIVGYLADRSVHRLRENSNDQEAMVILHDCVKTASYGGTIATLRIISDHVNELSLSTCKELIMPVWMTCRGSSWSQVRSAATRVFSALLIRLKQWEGQAVDAIFEELYASIDLQITEANTASEAALAALGPLVASLAMSKGGNDYYSRWNSALDLLRDDDAPFSTRKAALASAISFVRTFLELRTESSDTIFLRDAYLKLLDYLSDDDQDLREMATDFICTYILKSKYILTCVYCETSFAKLLVDMFGNKTESINGLILFAEKKITGTVSPSRQIEDAFAPDLSLFVVEKQNLYINDVQDATRWADLLIQVCGTAGDTDACQSSLRRLAEWEASAVALFLKAINMHGDDGPLGWTSNTEVFAFGRRVIEVYRVLKQCKSVPVQLAADFIELQRLAKDRDLHCLWNFEI
ncbi:putative death-receptor fusion protein-domain-containing protein [Lipomyces kononenkoae]|uniref:Death-receptor fusion protein-domain-containing protein n=1 Tax=Lipomyces kononenkoae TaxID=34357 RepID=A0ACC3T4Q8_LIPKO